MAATDSAERGPLASGHDPKPVGSSGHAPVRLRDIARVFAKLGTIGFGGGVGMLALIRQEVVERRRWIDDRQLSVAVAMGQMLPGPFVSNYAEYIGYELRGMRGMVTAAVALLAPSLVLMAVLSALYFRYGSVPLVTKLFAGVQPVVVGILAWATWNIGRANVRNRKAAIIGLVAAVALFFKGDVLLVVLGCGVLGIAFSGAWRQVKGNGAAALVGVGFWLGSSGGLALPAVVQKAGELALVFLKVGTVIFGGGLAAIPFLQHEVVDVRHWLTMREFIDGVALGQVTPGPVAITAAFIGYKVLGVSGALIAALGTFLPSTLMLWGLIHVYRRVSSNALVQGFLSGVMPAVAGMLLWATVFLGRGAIAGPVQAVLAPFAFCLLLRFKIEPVWLILGGALVGLVM
jgi:chromate transporter